MIVERRPWGWNDANVLMNARAAMRLRHQMIPYIYSFICDSHYQLGYEVGLVRPIYHHCKSLIGYDLPHQYFFAFDFLCSPFTSPIDDHISSSSQLIYFPPLPLPSFDQSRSEKKDRSDGKEHHYWYDYQTGDRYDADSMHRIYGDLSKLGVSEPTSVSAIHQNSFWRYQHIA